MVGMNSDFNAGRRRTSSFVSASVRQPMANQYDDVDVLAIAADDPFWDNGSLPQPDNQPGDFQSQDGFQQDDGGSKRPWYKRLTDKVRNLSRKQWIIIGAIVLVLTAGTAATLALILKDEPAPKATVSKAAPKPTPPPPPTSPLTGIEVSEADTKRPVIGLMIENSTDSRPQSGLQEAGVVYEAIAEYGITRFLALYQEANPANLGPVRSARPYYVDWARSYDAAYGHVGGSPDALAKIKAEGIRDIDQFHNAGSYRRISQRYAPHNVYTTGEQLRTLVASKGWASSTFTGLARKKEAKSAQPTATSININISGPTYNVHYDYDAASNSYHRSMAGSPHKDADTGKLITPKVVIGLATQYGLMADGYHSSYVTTGTGTAKIFQDGIVTEATWKRDGATAQYTFTDPQGKPVTLNPGQTWITVVGDPAAVTYTGPPPPAPTPAAAP